MAPPQLAPTAEPCRTFPVVEKDPPTPARQPALELTLSPYRPGLSPAKAERLLAALLPLRSRKGIFQRYFQNVIEACPQPEETRGIVQ